jgi:hypothetical protein
MGETVPEKDRRVWDMVLHLLHPVGIYVLLQLLILDHLGRAPALEGLGPLAPIPLGIYALQFLGAWTVFYTVLLRDMGYRSAAGTILLLGALLGFAAARLLVSRPAELGTAGLALLLGPQLLLALVSFPWTFARWRRLKAAWEADQRQRGGPAPAALIGFAHWFQQFEPGARGHSDATGWFYDVWIWLLVLVPLALAILVAAVRKKRTPGLPHLTDETFEPEVLASHLPVVVHAYHSWSVGDRVVENQVVRLAEAARGRLLPYWLDIARCPEVVAAYPTLGEKSVALFVGGRLVWQAQGVHDHLTILEEIEPYLPPGPLAGEPGEVDSRTRERPWPKRP